MAAPQNAATSSSGNAVSPDTIITIKISVNDVAKRLKLPLRDLGVNVLPDKLREILDIKPDQHVVLERYSDSAGGYITLDENKPQVFKTLIRAAKAKLKLRLKATVTPLAQPAVTEEKGPAEITPAVVPVALPIHASRDSTALDQRSIGSGIFQFREARASQQTLVNEDAPVPRPFVIKSVDSLPTLPPQPELAFRSRAPAEPVSNFGHAWSVYCNACDASMDDAHYHCSICDGGDYDLCEGCVASGKLCPGEGHWLIKRFIKDGRVIQSTTERVSPRARAESAELAVESVEPVAETKTLVESVPTRTCNNCVVVLPESEFVTCATCDDFDLCLRCHASDKHGHHPAHGFEPATEQTVLTLAARSKLAAGRNARHNAICDGCDEKIYGVRHKCLNCPDWDYCNECVKSASHTHRGHRFAALYEPIADQRVTVVRHYGIYCDGPLCSHKPAQSYIQGVRYKCAICNDTDFCAACEALPNNPHNRTHPLIKFKTPVRNVNVSTENEDVRGNVRVMGDRRSVPAPAPAPVPTRNAFTDAMPMPSINAATQVHTVADIKPTEVKREDADCNSAQTLAETLKTHSQGQTAPIMVTSELLNAHFVRDSIKDGMTIGAGSRFVQVWTLRNPGPFIWPAGCSVRYVGGDNMLNVDNEHPASVTAIAEATESNVVGRPVNVGEEVAFKVILKAPIRKGKSISYWRLKAPDGTPFGHRLWCDITVLMHEAYPTLPQGAPTQSTQPGCSPEAQNAIWQTQSMNQQPYEDHETPRHVLSSKSVENMQEEQRRAAFMHRVAMVKADVLRHRMQNQAQTLQANLEKLSLKGKKLDEDAKVRKIIEEVSKDTEKVESNDAKATEDLEGSQMVFPKLERESPISSTYQSMHSAATEAKAAYVENEEGEVEQSATAHPAPIPALSSPTAATDVDDADDDLEVLSAHDDISEDDGFMTDEEYDILDASDSETVASMK